MIVEIHLFGNLEELSLSPSATPHPLLDLMMNSSELASVVQFSRILQCHLDNLCCTFLLRHPESEVSSLQSDLNLGQI